MANITPLQRRQIRRERNAPLVDMNLVSLIDIFTILIFFLLSNSTEVQTLTSSKAVRLPESVAETSPKETVVVVVSNEAILVQGRKVADVAEVMASDATDRTAQGRTRRAGQPCAGTQGEHAGEPADHHHG